MPGTTSIESTIETAVTRKVIEEIEHEVGNAITREAREKLAARIIKVIDDYNREIAIVAIEKAKQTMVVAAVAAAAKEGLIDDK